MAPQCTQRTRYLRTVHPISRYFVRNMRKARLLDRTSTRNVGEVSVLSYSLCRIEWQADVDEHKPVHDMGAAELRPVQRENPTENGVNSPRRGVL